MNADWIRRVNPLPFGQGFARTDSSKRKRKKTHGKDGFTLVELLITLTILPLVIGALSFGIIAVFSLNTQTSHRLSDTAEAQGVASMYQKDVQGAGYITTDSTSSPQCGSGTGTQLLSLESVPNQTTGDFQSVIAYVGVPVTNGATTTDTLERLLCQNGSTTPVSEFTLAYDLPTPSIPAGAPPTYQVLRPPTITCSLGASASVCSSTGQQWSTTYIPAQDIGTVNFGVTEPSTNYTYNLDANPAASTSFNSGGVASTPAASCESTANSTGPYAGSLCLIDFSGLTPNELAVAESPNECYQMSVAVGTSDILHFCLEISGTPGESAAPWAIPTDTYAGLGNTVYPGLPGKPALYMSPYIGDTSMLTISLSAFSVVNASSGQPVSGWSFLSADAETTNQGETLTWTSNNTITILNDAEAGVPNNQIQDGNACPISGGGTTKVTCQGVLPNGSETAPLTGAAMVMVSGANLNSLVVTMNNYEAVSFGVFAPGS